MIMGPVCYTKWHGVDVNVLKADFDDSSLEIFMRAQPCCYMFCINKWPHYKGLINTGIQNVCCMPAGNGCHNGSLPL